MTGSRRNRLLGTASATLAAAAALALAAPQAAADSPEDHHGGVAARSTVDYGTWIRDVQAVIDRATPYVEKRSADAHKERQALVFDIDNTTLESDLGFSVPQHALYPSLELARYADSRGVDIFFVTARPDIIRPVTRLNLEQVGYEVDGLYVRHLPDLFREKAEYKADKRAEIEAKGYTIIANIGNTPSDLAGGHAERHYKLPDYDGRLS